MIFFFIFFFLFHYICFFSITFKINFFLMDFILHLFWYQRINIFFHFSEFDVACFHCKLKIFNEKKIKHTRNWMKCIYGRILPYISWMFFISQYMKCFWNYLLLLFAFSHFFNHSLSCSHMCFSSLILLLNPKIYWV